MGNVQTAGDENTQVEYIPGITTWNGAATYASVTDPLVELFFKSVRDIKCTDYRSIPVKESKKKLHGNNPPGSRTLEQYFDAAWEQDQLLTLKFVFYLRDCREGKGERKLFRALIRHLRESGRIQHLAKNLQHIPTFGTWKDLSLCFFGTELEDEVVSLIAEQLKKDKNQSADLPVSLCGKFAPREKGPFDRTHKAATKIAKALGVSLTGYRKQYLTPLKARLRLVERDMCAKEFEKIDYSHVPSIAGSNYSDAFKKHDAKRYAAYLESVKKGEGKMNTSVLMPYQIVAPYLRNGKMDDTLEAQWKSFVDGRREKWPSNLDVMPLVDVSGSMSTFSSPSPLEVAVSLGLLFSQLNSSPAYQGKFITFHENPEIFALPTGSLCDKVRAMKNSKWGGTTDIQKAFDLILNLAVTLKVPQDNMPKVLLILSDMQFNQADGGKTNFVVMSEKYRSAGYQLPIILYWNLNGNTIDYPVPSADHPGVILLSGYNDSILYPLMDGTLPNPHDIVHKALDAERYHIIQL